MEFTEFQHEALKAEVKVISAELEEQTKKANQAWRQKELQRLHVSIAVERAVVAVDGLLRSLRVG